MDPVAMLFNETASALDPKNDQREVLDLMTGLPRDAHDHDQGYSGNGAARAWKLPPDRNVSLTIRYL
jgi:hypothetical protein